MLIATIVLSCLSQAGATVPKSHEPFFEAKTPIVVPTQDEADATGWNLAQLVRDYERSTGHQVVATSEAEKALKACPTLCEDPQVLAPENLQVRFEEFIQGFNLVLLPGDANAPALVGLATRKSRNVDHLPLEPYLIDWTEVENFKERTSTLFQTLVPIQGAEARLLTNRLRGEITDARICQVLPLGGANCVLIQGTGRDVARLTRGFREPAREAGLEMPKMAPVPAAPASKADATKRSTEWADRHLMIPAGDDVAWTVADLCAAYSKLSGITVELDPDAEAEAKSTTLGLSHDFSIRGPEVPYAFEFLCRTSGFYLAPSANGAALTLMPTRGAKPATAAKRSIEEISAWSTQLAQVVEVDFPLKSFDPRILANTLRVFAGPPEIEGMTVEPGSQVLKLRGFAPRVAGRIRLFREAERLSEALRSADPNREE